MELLEADGPRPRQARYQAALRPDILRTLFYSNWRDCFQEGSDLGSQNGAAASAGNVSKIAQQARWGWLMDARDARAWPNLTFVL